MGPIFAVFTDDRLTVKIKVTDFIVKIITFITHFGGGQLTSQAICTVKEISA